MRRALATFTFYDASGAVVETIANYNVPADDPTNNLTTIYNSNATAATSTVTTYTGTTNPVDDGTTTSVYGVTGCIASNSLLQGVVYTDGYETSYTYDRQGEVVSMTDQNGTVHDYAYDKLGREISDTATVAAWHPYGVDTAVKEIDYGYDVRGNLQWVTSKDGSGVVVSQDYMQYNDANLLAAEYQNPSGSITVDGGIVTDDTLYTAYTYDAAHGYRLTSVQYPNGRTVFYDYGQTGSADDSLNRLSSIVDDSNGDGVKETTDQVLATYQYLGLDTIVSEQQPGSPGSGLTMDYFGDATTSAERHEYLGLDRFNRVMDECALTTAATSSRSTSTATTFKATSRGRRTSWPTSSPRSRARPRPISTSFTRTIRLANSRASLAANSTPRRGIVSGTENLSQDQTWTPDALGISTARPTPTGATKSPATGTCTTTTAITHPDGAHQYKYGRGGFLWLGWASRQAREGAVQFFAQRDGRLIQRLPRGCRPEVELVARGTAVKTPIDILPQVCRKRPAPRSVRPVNRARPTHLAAAPPRGDKAQQVQHRLHADLRTHRAKINS